MPDPLSAEQLFQRLQRLEKQNARLAEQNRSLSDRLEEQKRQYDQLNGRMEGLTTGAGGTPALSSSSAPSASASSLRNNILSPGAPAAEEDGTSSSDASARPRSPKYLIGGYDEERGQFILVRPADPASTPYELRLDVFTQARYTNFGPSARTWVDSTGTPRPIRSISTWEITRNFVQLSGYAIDPRLQFTAFLFSSTAINDTVYLGWINYHFNDAFDLRVGNWSVPGTREWITSFRYTLGVDRSMATTFFRPNISPGIWAQGEPLKGFHYVAMLANSLNRFNQGIERIGSSFAFGGTAWWEPLGKYGLGPSDIENHQALVTRLGINLAVSHEANQGTTDERLPNPEDTIIRLSDGTPLFRPGALGPGVALTGAGVQLWTMDAAIKYRGLGISGEYFFRWLDDFTTVGQRAPFTSLFDNGALLQGGYFILPTRLEPYARTSFVSGHFGTGSEVGAGLNWYPRGSRDWRLTCEALYINKSPAQNLLTGYRAGASGTLLQLQCFVDF